MFRLRGMGLYTNQIMSRHLSGRGYGDHEQFLIACLVTGDEIWQCDTGVLDEYKVFLRRVKEFKFDERFIWHRRDVVLRMQKGITHTERRGCSISTENR
ncbi:hypothetical protein DPMN_032932 [Dreissena polymorpha]|uniref:Uncharacterized protein n=1 Tax=Dreissena polymorpha TaxID=45954 RepID=A0A9D4RKK1_DREPO|nr:hypothetical protein DPMN_032932 [Dreissena polymorpha]